MSKLIFAIFCLILSATLVFWAGGAVLNGTNDAGLMYWILGGGPGENPKGLNELLTEKASYNKTLADIGRIKTKLIDLQKTQSSISQTDLDKLNKFIPSHIDNVNLIIDVNNIAAKQGMTIKNVRVGGATNSVGVTDSNLASPNGILPATMSFSVSGNYQTLLGFLDDLANSLRVVDPVSLSFAVDEKGLNQYNFEIKTYWVK
ncbi:MAG: type 4a pilus biogenesis protein PilO [Candidatus Vogelbacteria bacterium]|nr:type 4a pilus biogenesis protein PilO [Candidatus Vogelbacteria bacterium]